MTSNYQSNFYEESTNLSKLITFFENNYETHYKGEMFKGKENAFKLEGETSLSGWDPNTGCYYNVMQLTEPKEKLSIIIKGQMGKVKELEGIIKNHLSKPTCVYLFK